MPSEKFKLWILIATFGYTLLHFTWYWQTPLGLSPVLDSQENILLAEKIAFGSLEKEPFYRAMLYPFFLSLFISAGLSVSSLPAIAGILGLLCHCLNTALAMLVSEKVWQSRSSIVVTGILIGTNPVLIHFAAELIDVTLATSLFLGGLLSYLKSRHESSGKIVYTWVALAASLLALSTLARPHLMAPVIAICGIITLVLFVRRREWMRSISFLSGATVIWLAYGFIQLSWSGSFGILPWQGAYNLWASNKPGANGLYLTQTYSFNYQGEHRNPTRLEEETAYIHEVGRLDSIDQRSHYWRSKTINRILENPGDWLRLMAWKTYALVNNFEQYNNKTYSFHKRLSPWLRGNPICWGILLLFGFGGFIAGFKRERLLCIQWLVITLSLSAGILIYMASAKFRVPLVFLLAIMAGGTPFFRNAIAELGGKSLSVIAGFLTLSAFVTFSTFGEIDSKRTIIQDQLLLADASTRIGRDHEAFFWASEAVKSNPERIEGHRVHLISFYNLVASGDQEGGKEAWLAFREALPNEPTFDASYSFVGGIAHWNIGNFDIAKRIWQASVTEYGWGASSSLGILVLTNSMPVPTNVSDEIIKEIKEGAHGILAYALITRDSSFRNRISMTRQRESNFQAILSRVLPHAWNSPESL